MPIIAENTDNARAFTAAVLFYPHHDRREFREPGLRIVLVLEGQHGAVGTKHIGPDAFAVFDCILKKVASWS